MSDQVLSNLVLPSRVNQCWQYSGIDSPEECLDKEFFFKYPHKISYQYNSRGFRDAEWPDTVVKLQNSIWCLGDSFTVGLGSPIEHIWPQVLQQQTGCRTINVSMDGASNDWIARKACNILQEVQPKTMILQWSYLHRRESPNQNLTDEMRRIFAEDLDFSANLNNFLKCIDSVEQNKSGCQVIHSVIPNTGLVINLRDIWNQVKGPSWPESLPSDYATIPDWIHNELKTAHKLDFKMLALAEKAIQVKQTDRARDSHHYDLKTSQWFCQLLAGLLN